MTAAISSVAQSALSSASGAVSSKIQTLKDANIKQMATDAVLSASAEAINQINGVLSTMNTVLTSAIDRFKKVPPALRKAVDIQGAANAMYDKMDDCAKNFSSMVSSVIVSVEVPITSSDYESSPYKYPNLLNIDALYNKVTDEDCLSSGYTKVSSYMSPTWIQNFMSAFQPPEDRDVVADAMERVVNTTVKTTWNIVKPPIQTVGQLAQVDILQDTVKGVTDAIDGMVQLATAKVDKAALNEKIAAQGANQGKLADEAVKAGQQICGSIGQSVQDMASQAASAAEAMAQGVQDAAAGAIEGAMQAFDQIKCPEMPDDIKETIEDFKDAVIMVKDNISNIYIVLLLRMMGKVFDCFNDIVGVIGVPKIPDPLGQIPQVIADMQKVMDFVMGLPMSLVETLKAILKKKVKAMQIAQQPTPPEPVATKTPLPPTSEDVVKPDMSWEDVKRRLKDDFGFSDQNSLKIVQDIQAFYDGSGADTQVVSGVQYEDTISKDGKQYESRLPVYILMKRVMIQPLVCYDTWLDQHVVDAGTVYTTDGDEVKLKMLEIPKKGEYKPTYFCRYDVNGEKQAIELKSDFGMHYYTNQAN